ncbi:coiled-coil domain-containing protein 66 isoform X7 [Danio rerio]|uniref:Coiled-coil domain-containing protein 66 isoform X7 n=2 Tax=Danio rerio TaxID=7955 RepID=A0AC58IHP0_DANRE
MMNLGDGLLFQLENGKPRLVLAKYGAQSKTSHKKASGRNPPRKKTIQLINPKPGPCQPDRDEPGRKHKDAPAAGSTGNCMERPRIPNARRRMDTMSSEAARVQSEIDRSIVTPQNESVVCLTQEQFQQILSSINSRSAENTHSEAVVSSEENCAGKTGAEEPFVLEGCDYKHRASEEKPDKLILSDGQQSGLFSTFGEREREREKLEAKKAQWRRELDEQMALKRQQKARLREKTAPNQACEVRLKDLSDSTAAATERLKPRAPPQMQRELPAAIRSAFIVGEAAPVEDMFNTQREEQQRRWLQELDQQIQEAKLRRKHDKQINSQVEDIELWAAHFDSLQQPLTVAPKPEVPDSSLSHHPSVSGSLCTAWEGMSACGADSLGRASVDTAQGNKQRSSYLRTMTALLDPAQIEERERRRLKQLEHQQAIEAQVEERRRQKEKEEARRRAQEQEEERRVEREQERLQQQYMKDTERQRHKEEVQTRKTEELYLSIQKAQEEALKEKQVQRIRDLAKKGHDVSKLLQSLDGASQEVSHQPENESIRDPAGAGMTDTAPLKAQHGRKTHHEELKVSDNSKEHTCSASKEAGADPYEPYARTGRNHKPEKKPEWNTKRPSKAFVPASERYPKALQRHRQESRRQRQIELMALVERSAPQPEPVHNHKPQAQRHRQPPQLQGENQHRDPSAISADSRGTSPPVTAVKQHVHRPSQQRCRQVEEEMAQPPLLDYVPYVRTDEVYHMEALAPLSRPSTREAQQRVNAGVSGGGGGSRQATPLLQQDLNSTERQQAILKGLSELRQGLLQRQRELETSLNPALQTTQPRNSSSQFRPV